MQHGWNTTRSFIMEIEFLSFEEKLNEIPPSCTTTSLFMLRAKVTICQEIIETIPERIEEYRIKKRTKNFFSVSTKSFNNLMTSVSFNWIKELFWYRRLFFLIFIFIFKKWDLRLSIKCGYMFWLVALNLITFTHSCDIYILLPIINCFLKFLGDYLQSTRKQIFYCNLPKAFPNDALSRNSSCYYY